MSPVFSFVVSVCTFKPKMMKWEDITDEARKATEQALTDLLTENRKISGDIWKKNRNNGNVIAEKRLSGK